MLPVSVVIITFNEEKNLGRCLSSVTGFADEIIIVDSYSTDATLQIAAAHNAKVVSRAFDGYAQQKNFATSLAANEWVLSLDADEELTPELINSIRSLGNNPDCGLYRIPRLTNYCGQWIRHCGWYPDLQGRLYNRTRGAWEEKKVHEFWKFNSPTDKEGVLKGDLLHYSFASISEHMRKIEKYSELAAQAAAEQGRSAGILKIIFSPFWRFFSEYFIKLGFLDGYYGYVICRLSAYSAFAKYTKIRQYARK